MAGLEAAPEAGPGSTRDRAAAGSRPPASGHGGAGLGHALRQYAAFTVLEDEVQAFCDAASRGL